MCVVKLSTCKVENVPEAGEAPPIVVPSIVPPLISAVVATKDAAVVTPAALTDNLSVPSFCSTTNKLAVCDPTPLTARVNSIVVSPVIVAPAATTN